MPVGSTSHFYSSRLASNTMGTTCLAICMFTSTHVILSFDCGTLTGFDTQTHTHTHTGEGLIVPMRLINADSFEYVSGTDTLQLTSFPVIPTDTLILV